MPVVGTTKAPREPEVVQVRFDAPDQLVVDVDARHLEHTVVPRDRMGGFVVADHGGSHGVVMPLSPVVGEGGARRFAITATSTCPAAWLLDVAAPLLEAAPAVVAAAGPLRAGCGPVAHADFVTAIGRERTIVYGAAAFDPRSLASELAVVRSDLERQFDVQIGERWLNEIVVLPAGREPNVVVVPASTGLHIRVDAASGWTAEHRVAASATIARIWLTKLFELLAPSPGDLSPERASLVHGLALGMARETLLELGLLTPDEYAASLSEAQRSLAVRTGVWRTDAVVDARDVAASAAARSIEVAQVAWMLRDRGTPMSLPRLLEQAVEEGAPREAQPLWASVVDGLPRSAGHRMGACYTTRQTRTDVHDLGVVVAWSPEGGTAVGAVRDDGVAARAGVRVGDEITRITSTGEVVSLELVQGEKPVSIKVTAPPKAVPTRGWVRRPEVTESRCYPAI